MGWFPRYIVFFKRTIIRHIAKTEKKKDEVKQYFAIYINQTFI